MTGRSETDGRDALAWTALLLVAAGVRVAAWSRTVVLFNDGPVFLSMAEAVGEGRWSALLDHPYHPFYPAVIAGTARFVSSLETAAVGVSIAGGLLALVALHVLWRDAFGREVAWLGSWIVALHPWAVDFSSDVMSDGLYAGLYLTALAALARSVSQPGVTTALVAGVATGLAYWTRPEGLGLAAVGGLLLVARAVAAKTIGLRRRAVAAGTALTLAAVAVAVPYVLALESRTGELALTHKKSVTELAGGASEEDPVAVTTGRDAPEPVGEPLVLPELAIRSDGPGPTLPARSAIGLLEATGRVAATGLATLRFELLPWLALGLLGALRRRGMSWSIATIVLPTVLYAGVLVLLVWGAGYVSRRHALVVALPWIGFAAMGWRGAVEWISTRGDHSAWGDWARSGRGIGLALVLVLALGWGPRDLRPRRADRVAVRSAAEWLASQHPDSGPVAAQKLRIAYYAGAPFVPLPSGREGRLELSLRARGTRWIVIDEAKLGDHLGLAEGIGSWSSLRYRSEAAGRRAIVLELESEAAD